METAKAVSSIYHYIDLYVTPHPMQIFGALGLGLTIIILQSTVPTVFRELLETIVVALDAAQATFSVVSLLAGAAAIPR